MRANLSLTQSGSNRCLLQRLFLNLLLRGGPAGTYWRQRNGLVQAAGRHIQRMQKTLTQMNIQLANVLSEVSGVTGQAVIRAIPDGERDPHTLAELRDRTRSGGWHSPDQHRATYCTTAGNL